MAPASKGALLKLHYYYYYCYYFCRVTVFEDLRQCHTDAGGDLRAEAGPRSDGGADGREPVSRREAVDGEVLRPAALSGKVVQRVHHRRQLVARPDGATGPDLHRRRRPSDGAAAHDGQGQVPSAQTQAAADRLEARRRRRAGEGPHPALEEGPAADPEEPDDRHRGVHLRGGQRQPERHHPVPLAG